MQEYTGTVWANSEGTSGRAVAAGQLALITGSSHLHLGVAPAAFHGRAVQVDPRLTEADPG